MNQILEKGHSRIPVYYDQPTNIIGLILVLVSPSFQFLVFLFFIFEFRCIGSSSLDIFQLGSGSLCSLETRLSIVLLSMKKTVSTYHLGLASATKHFRA